ATVLYNLKIYTFNLLYLLLYMFLFFFDITYVIYYRTTITYHKKIVSIIFVHIIETILFICIWKCPNLYLYLVHHARMLTFNPIPYLYKQLNIQQPKNNTFNENNMDYKR